MNLRTEFLASYPTAQYRRERKLIDALNAWLGDRNSYHPSELPRRLRQVDNAMRSRVERFELYRDKPEKIVAYIGQPNRNGMGLDRVFGQSYPVTVWTGEPIGFATLGTSWRKYGSHWGTHMHQFYARIDDREYTGRNMGAGMAIVLRETAESKRARNA